MNLLIEELPEAVEIDGIEYPINTDFRACLRVISAYEDNDLTAYEKHAILLANLYPKPPHDMAKAIEQAIKFLNGGSTTNDDEIGAALRLYSFKQDAGLIFAAFKQTHGIDLLDTEYLHWWKFLALFSDLGTETTFCNLVSLRKRVKTGKASKEERAAARELGERFDVPEIDNRTPDEKEQEAEFMRLIKQSKRKDI